MPNNSCAWEYISNTNATADEKHQFERLMDICDNQCLLQIIDESTREENTLDLIFTNETSLVTMIEVNKTKLSDHNIIEVSTNYIIDEHPQLEEITENSNSILRSLNFQTKSINWKDVNQCIEITEWEQSFENKDTIGGSRVFEEKIIKMCVENMPKKMKERKNKIPKERRKMLNRIKMLKRNIEHTAEKKRKK